LKAFVQPLRGKSSICFQTATLSNRAAFAEPILLTTSPFEKLKQVKMPVLKASRAFLEQLDGMSWVIRLQSHSEKEISPIINFGRYPLKVSGRLSRRYKPVFALDDPDQPNGAQNVLSYPGLVCHISNKTARCLFTQRA
jgi:hypothetical protein